MHLPPKKDTPLIKTADLPQADGFIFATPTARPAWDRACSAPWPLLGPA